MAELKLACGCGEITGTISVPTASSINRLVCYCADCQAFVHHLGQAGQVLDKNGGSDLFQSSLGRVCISTGRENLACIRLKPNGLLRWYAHCCATPLGNTNPGPGMPFIGLSHVCVGDAVDGRSRDDVVGQIRGRFNLKSANGDTSALQADKGNLVVMILRILRIMIGARFRGEHRVSDFFNADSKAPVAAPVQLSDDERKRAYSA